MYSQLYLFVNRSWYQTYECMNCVGEVQNEILERGSSSLECNSNTEYLPGATTLQNLIKDKFIMIEKKIDKTISDKLEETTKGE